MKRVDDPAAPARESLKDANGDEARSVAEGILYVFIKTLAAKPDYEEVATRMKREIIDKQGRSEAALRRALFGDDG